MDTDYCKVWREPKWSHCYECNACVKELDHHCPWTSKCVGAANLKVFYAFVTLVQTLFCYAIIIIIVFCVRKY
jgi:hypothetical protein